MLDRYIFCWSLSTVPCFMTKIKLALCLHQLWIPHPWKYSRPGWMGLLSNLIQCKVSLPTAEGFEGVWSLRSQTFLWLHDLSPKVELPPSASHGYCLSHLQCSAPNLKLLQPRSGPWQELSRTKGLGHTSHRLHSSFLHGVQCFLS